MKMNIGEGLLNVGISNSKLLKAIIDLQLSNIGAVQSIQKFLDGNMKREQPFRAEIEAYDLPLSTDQSLSLNLDGQLRQVEFMMQSSEPCFGTIYGTVDDETWFVLDTWPETERVHAIIPTSVRKVRVTVPKVDDVEDGKMDILLVAT